MKPVWTKECYQISIFPSIIVGVVFCILSDIVTSDPETKYPSMTISSHYLVTFVSFS